MFKTAEQVNSFIKERKEHIFIALFANSIPRITTYLPLAEKLELLGIPYIFILPKLLSDIDFEYKHIKHCKMNYTEIKQLRGVDIFLSAEGSVNFAPNESIRVAYVHSLPDISGYVNYSGFLKSDPSSVKEIDYLFVPTRQMAKHWRVENYKENVSGLFPKEMLTNRRNYLTVVPGGYPKIEYLKKKCGTVGQPDRIVFSPTRSTLKHSVVEKYGIDVISLLLRTFKNFKVVFRPYPVDDPEKLSYIASYFSDEKRFVYDTSVTGEENIARALFTVTDRSSASVTYSLATARPSFFFRPDRMDGERDFPPIGRYVHSLYELQQELNTIESSLDYFSKHIKEERANYVYQAGSAVDYFISNIDNIKNEVDVEDWLKIPRDPIEITGRKDIQLQIENLRKRAVESGDPRCLKLLRTYEEFYY